jgi:hypothetical protein
MAYKEWKKWWLWKEERTFTEQLMQAVSSEVQQEAILNVAFPADSILGFFLSKECTIVFCKMIDNEP